MKKSDWKYILKWENLFYAIPVLTGLVIAILGFFNKIGSNGVNIAILLVLTSITSLLLVSHIVMTKLKDHLEDPVISKILKPYEKMIEEIRSCLKSADEIWLLTRTGQSFIEYEYVNEFEKIIKKGRGCFLFLNPENGALKMVANTVKEELKELSAIRNNPEFYKKYLNSLIKRSNNEIKLKVIDHLPAWTLVIINPRKMDEDSVIYVELATYRAKHKGRPAFKLTHRDGEYFNMFLNEFDEMWESAEDWTLREDVNNSR